MSSKEDEVVQLHKQVLQAWNDRDANAYSNHFTVYGNAVGFDGSHMHGREGIRSEISRIFASHKTAPYVSKIREVRMLSSDIASLIAVVGMIDAATGDINPSANA